MTRAFLLNASAGTACRRLQQAGLLPCCVLQVWDYTLHIIGLRCSKRGGESKHRVSQQRI